MRQLFQFLFKDTMYENLTIDEIHYDSRRLEILFSDSNESKNYYFAHHFGTGSILQDTTDGNNVIPLHLPQRTYDQLNLYDPALKIAGQYLDFERDQQEHKGGYDDK